MKRHLRFFIYIFSLFTFCSSQQSLLFAQKPSFEFSSRLSNDTILLGDRVDLSINAKLPKGFDIQFPFFADSLIRGIEVLGKPAVDTIQSKKDIVELLYKLQITSFDSGSYRIPGFRLPFTDGKVTDTVITTPLWLVVNTLPTDSAVATIYDIKPPLSQPITFAEVAPWLGGSLLFLAIIALAIYYFVRRKKNQPLFFPRKEKVPAHIVALRELEKLLHKKAWETDQPKHYFSILTDILRTYIEERFRIQAMEQTTFEIINDLKKGDDIDVKLISQLEDVLALADLVKFAKLITTVDENKESLDFGFRFVNQTTIIEEIPDSSEKSDESTSAKKEVISENSAVEPIKENEL